MKGQLVTATAEYGTFW